MLKRRSMLLVLGGLLASGILAHAGDREDKLKEEINKLQGAWQGVTFDGPGENMPKEDVPKMLLTIKGTRATSGPQTSEFVLDPSKKPQWIDFHIESTGTEKTPDGKPGKTRKVKVTAQGIYKLEGDSLTLCLSGPGSQRPTRFMANEEAVLITFKRKKQ